MYYFKIIIASILSVLYSAYLIEMYRHLTHPIQPVHINNKQKINRLILFFIGIVITLGLAYIIRQFVLPRPIFNLIVVSLEAIFIIPFFGAIFTDHLLHAWRQVRLPYAISMFNIIATALIAIASNLLIIFGSEKTIIRATSILNVTNDIIVICLILALGFLGIGYWSSAKK